MIVRLAIRSLAVRPIRTIVLACGFGLGIAVMAALLGVGDVILEQARAPELQVNTCGPEPWPHQRADDKGEIEPHTSIRRTSVEIQPLRPRRCKLRQIGLWVKAIECAEHVAGIDVRPPRIRGSIRPRGDIFDFAVADRFFETRYTAARRDWNRLAAFHQEYRRPSRR